MKTVSCKRGLASRVIFTVKSVIDFQTLQRHEINSTTACNMEAYSLIKIWVLNPNLAIMKEFGITSETSLLIEVVYCFALMSRGQHFRLPDVFFLFTHHMG